MHAGTLAARAGAAVGVMALVAAVGFPGVVSAGEFTIPMAEVTTTTCDAEGGTITVNIIDNTRETYDVLLDGVVVAAGRTDTDVGDDPEDPELIGPLDDGTYNVQVVWLESENNPAQDLLLDEDVTIDCVPDEPTTPPADPEPETAPELETAPVVAAPRYTG